MSHIEDHLRKIAKNMSVENSQTSSNISPRVSVDLPGDPDCPKCQGVGYLRIEDLPIDHPQFGKLIMCDCQAVRVAQKTRNRLLRLGDLEAYRQYTFDNFNPKGRGGNNLNDQASLEGAFNQCRHFASEPKRWLLLIGAYGVGKTHLSAAISNYYIDRGGKVIFIVVPELLDWLRSGFADKELPFNERFEEIKNIDLLVLDDLGTQSATSWAEEKLFQLINHRYVNQLPTVLTTNQNMEEIEGRIRSRINDAGLVTKVYITVPDYRLAHAEYDRYSGISSLSHHSDQLFSNFTTRDREGIKKTERDNLIKALKAAKEYSENPQGWLIFTGPHGCGKTHLAASIGNKRASEGDQPIFVFVPDFLDHLRATFNPSSHVSFDSLFEEARTSKLLILDGWGTHSSSPWAKEKLYQIINYRYNNKLPMVITTALHIEELDNAIKSRLLDGRLCRIQGITAPTFSVPRTQYRKG